MLIDIEFRINANTEDFEGEIKGLDKIVGVLEKKNLHVPEE